MTLQNRDSTQHKTVIYKVYFKPILTLKDPYKKKSKQWI
jgi:hypothetical protein